MRFNAFLLPLNSNFLRRGYFKIQKNFQNFNNFSKVTNLHRVKNNTFLTQNNRFYSEIFEKNRLISLKLAQNKFLLNEIRVRGTGRSMKTDHGGPRLSMDR